MDFISLAKTKAQTLPPEKVAAAQELQTAVNKALAKGSELAQSMFGIERVAQTSVKQNIEALKKEQEGLVSMARFGAKYSRIPLEPLTWRNEEGLPRLAVFTLDSPTFRISRKAREVGSYRWDGSFHFKRKYSDALPSGLPKQIAACYKDVIVTLGKRSRGKTVTLTCQFEGVLPDEVRPKIHDAIKDFGKKNVFIIASADHAKITTRKASKDKPRPMNPDPLVVGWDGENLWLVAAFDVTPVEQAMAMPAELKDLLK